MSTSLQPHGLYSPWNSPGQNTGVGSLSLLQGIFPTQGMNPDFLHFRSIFYQLNHKGSPRILEWVAYPFSRGSSQPRNWTRVSCTASGFFTTWDNQPICSDQFFDWMWSDSFFNILFPMIWMDLHKSKVIFYRGRSFHMERTLEVIYLKSLFYTGWSEG